MHSMSSPASRRYTCSGQPGSSPAEDCPAAFLCTVPCHAMYATVSSASCVHAYVLSIDCRHILSFHSHTHSKCAAADDSSWILQGFIPDGSMHCLQALDTVEAPNCSLILTVAACAGVQVDQQ